MSLRKLEAWQTKSMFGLQVGFSISTGHFGILLITAIHAVRPPASLMRAGSFFRRSSLMAFTVGKPAGFAMRFHAATARFAASAEVMPLLASSAPFSRSPCTAGDESPVGG